MAKNVPMLWPKRMMLEGAMPGAVGRDCSVGLVRSAMEGGRVWPVRAERRVMLSIRMPSSVGVPEERPKPR